VLAIEGIRERDPKGEILVVSEEPFENYSRPLISYFLGGRIPRERMVFRDSAFYRDMRTEVLSGTRAASLDFANREVVLAGGKKTGYGKLLLATGGKPFIPAIEGVSPEIKGVFSFSGLQDALDLKAHIEEMSVTEAIVLGARLIGLKAAEGLLMRGVRVTLVEMADRILANTFDLKGSTIMEELLVRHGSTVIKNDTIASITRSQGRIEAVILKSGRTLSTKCLVIAVGVRPNTDLVQGTQIEMNRGIRVNDRMETNIPGVFAAGDVAESPEFFERKHALMAIWPIAARTGRISGINMAGGQRHYQGLFPMNAVQVLDLPTISFGITDPKDPEFHVIERHEPARSFYRKLVLKDNRLVGAILIGEIERAGIYGLLIRERIDVAPFEKELLSDTFGFLMLPKEFRKHMVTGEGIEV